MRSFDRLATVAGPVQRRRPAVEMVSALPDFLPPSTSLDRPTIFRFVSSALLVDSGAA